MKNRILQNIATMIWPTCDVSGKPFLAINNKAKVLKVAYKANGITDYKVETLSHLSPEEFKRLITFKCDQTKEPFDLRKNKAMVLKKLFSESGVEADWIDDLRLLSPAGFKMLLMVPCSLTGDLFDIRKNKANEIKTIYQRAGVSDSKVSALKPLSPEGFKKLLIVQCDLSGLQFDVRKNRASKLRENYQSFGVSDASVMNAVFVSPQIYAAKELTRCIKTGKVFLNKEDCYSRFASDLYPCLAPRHPDCKLEGKLSPDGFRLLQQEVAGINYRLQNWVKSIRGDELYGYNSSLRGTVYTDEECDSPEDVESLLRTYSAQLGGNALVNYEWKCHKEKYIAGYSKNDNPYYKTKKWFTGTATAVYAELRRKKCRFNKAGASNNTKPSVVMGTSITQAKSSGFYAQVLGVTDDTDLCRIQRAHHELIKKHNPPEKIVSKKDKETARKFVEINEAYSYFRVKLG